ncbi:MAG: hypothetical protein ACRDZ6_01120 [Acidimicrobiales bacterium]
MARALSQVQAETFAKSSAATAASYPVGEAERVLSYASAGALGAL